MDSDSKGSSEGGPLSSVTLGDQAGRDDPGRDILLAAIEATRMPMVLSDPHRPDNPIVFANQAFAHMTGYDRAEIVGRNCRFLQGPDTDPDTIAQIRHAIRDRTELATELLNYRKDGTSFWNALFVSPIFNKGGTLVYFFASQLDVSRRRDAEEALRQGQTTETVAPWAGSFAHEFSNLLQVISGHMDGLKDHAATSSDARLIRRVGAVSEAADRATSLIQKLLAFSRQQHKPQTRTVNLNAVISGMTDLVDRTLGGAIEVTTRLEAALWNSRLDPLRAESAILNIILNARDAMPEGGTITIETANLDLPLTHASAPGSLTVGRYGVVVISDTGTGMPDDVLKRVTEPFFTTKAEGRGLGLATAHLFARQSGGALRLESTVGRGTVVRLYLPAAHDGDQPIRTVGRQAVHRGGTERILVVDDRAEVAELARTMLEDAGYAVMVAKDGRDALTKLHFGFDLMFSDLIMPGGLDGVALAREAQRRQPGLKVLLTTGYADTAGERTDVGGTAFDTIAKPYRRADLARKVRAVLDGPTDVD